MRMVAAIGLGALICATVAACSSVPVPTGPLDRAYRNQYVIDAVKTMEPQGSEFLQGLRSGYLQFAERQQGGAQAEGYLHLLEKGIAVSSGELVPPDPPPANEELQAAHARLTAALDRTARWKAPLPAARAQTAYDCWIVELNYVAGRRDCRLIFYDAMVETERALGAVDETYLVFFPWDSTALTPVAERTLDGFVEAIGSGRPVGIVVAGHADRSGSAAYNQRLSRLRAQVVADALAARGLDAATFRVEAFGETRPRVPTADGVREPQNRRVELTAE